MTKRVHSEAIKTLRWEMKLMNRRYNELERNLLMGPHFDAINLERDRSIKFMKDVIAMLKRDQRRRRHRVEQ